MQTGNELSSRAVHFVVIGSSDFQRRMNALFLVHKNRVKASFGSITDGWSLVLASRPDSVIVEIGMGYDDRAHSLTKSFLAQLRERIGKGTYVVGAILSPAHLAYAGDLLFQNENDLQGSGYIDTFIAVPPGMMPSIPDLGAQLDNVVQLLSLEIARQAGGKDPLPALGTPGWVQSLADPKSRELWMKWLPRYASYTNENPFIIGDTGTGKTNLAYALHLLSGRSGAFISITPRDFSSSELVQAELFGAVEGAYTGAVDKWGLVKKAEKGTLFIDELQSIDKDLQGKLITFIENKAYRRVGSSESIEADVRFVFASNRSLSHLMDDDTLRHDFAYRLERVQLELAQLQSRRLDICSGMAFALAKIHRQRSHSKLIQGVTNAAYRLLCSHRWPGNLRQLENYTAKLCELTDMRRTHIIDEQAVVEVFESALAGTPATAAEVIVQAANTLSRQALLSSLTDVHHGVEKFVELVRIAALESTGGDSARAATLIGDEEKLLQLACKSIVAKGELERLE